MQTEKSLTNIEIERTEIVNIDEQSSESVDTEMYRASSWGSSENIKTVGLEETIEKFSYASGKIS